MIVEYDDFDVRYKAKESDQWKTVGIDELILNYADTRWVPVTERLPEKEGLYLISHQSGKIFVDEWIDGCGWSSFEAITAWMLLPELYKEADE